MVYLGEDRLTDPVILWNVSYSACQQSLRDFVVDAYSQVGTTIHL